MLQLAPHTTPVVGHLQAWVGAAQVVLAHQGGWDEILMVLVPVSVFAALLFVANQRAMRIAARQSADGAPLDDPDRDDSGRDTPRNERGGPI